MSISSFLCEDKKRVSNAVVISDICIEDLAIFSKNRKENNIITSLTISVSDKLAKKNSGVCINPLYKDRIFQSYYRRAF
jgi:hypothetical protein